MLALPGTMARTDRSVFNKPQDHCLRVPLEFWAGLFAGIGLCLVGW